MNTQLRLSLLPAFAFSAMVAAAVMGCGGGGTNPVVNPPSEDERGWGEADLTEGVRLTPTGVVALNLEPKGQTSEGDTGADGEDRIPYRLDKPTRMVVEMDPENPMYITLIASATGKLVFEVGPENPKVEMDLPAADYDLYVHSTSGESQAVFARATSTEATRSGGADVLFNVHILFDLGGCVGCNLRLAKIDGLQYSRGVNLERAVLFGATFKNSNLGPANFAGANLSLASFTNVTSPGANLAGLTLDRVMSNNWDLKGANLSGVTFSRNDLKGIKLDNANLDRAKLVSTTFSNGSAMNTNFGQTLLVQDSKFDGIDLTGSSFPLPAQVAKFALANCKLPNTRLRDFTLSPDGITFENCDLSRSDFTGAKFANVATFSGNDLSYTTLPGGPAPTRFFKGKMVGTDLRGLTGTGTRFEHVDMTNANLANANLTNAVIEYCILKGANMEGIRLNTASIVWTNLDGAVLTGGAQLTNIDMQMSEMSSADLTAARFHAKLLSCRIRNSKLNGADFSGSSYEGTDFMFADFRQARLVGNVDLGDNDFGNANFSGATWTNGRVCAEGSIGGCN